MGKLHTILVIDEEADVVQGIYEYDRCGLGLGLTVAKAFVEMHGGHVGVEDALGRGSTFTVELPAGTRG